MLNLLTPDDLFDHAARIASAEGALDDALARIAALEAAPPSSGGGSTLIASAEANLDDAITFTLGQDYDRLILDCAYVTADSQPGALLTAHLSSDGVNFDLGRTYINTGLNNWPGEPNAAYWPQPYALGVPQTLNLGCRMAIDVGERLDLGVHCRTAFTAMGTVSGNPVSPIYRCEGYVGFIGGAAGVSPRPAHSGGGTWFSGDPYGTPFDWPAQYQFAGHWKAPGQRIRGIKLTMGGGGTAGRKIKTGRFELRAVS